MTTNNLLGCEIVLMTGETVRIGGKHLDAGGYDLLGVITGSEGLLGVVTEITVRILKKPECARAVLVGFRSSEDAGECVSKIIGAGIIPAGMEMMDAPAIHAVEQFVHAGYPLDVEALLIVEVGRPQGSVSGGRPHLTRLLLHGRHHSAGAAASGPQPHARAVAGLRVARRQRLSRRRRQSAPAHSLRRQQARRA